MRIRYILKDVTVTLTGKVGAEGFKKFEQVLKDKKLDYKKIILKAI